MVKGGLLVIVRHGESEWNARGLWTGTTDVHLTPKGESEAVMIGQALDDIKFDYAFASKQIRSCETLNGILHTMGQQHVPQACVAPINERDYGIYTGKNKWAVEQEIGETTFNKLRRGWDYPVEAGETLKDVYARAVPFYKETIVPMLREGDNVLVVAHGNSIRSLQKYIESLSDEAIEGVEMLFGTALIYQVDQNGKMVDKQVRQIDTAPPASA